MKTGVRNQLRDHKGKASVRKGLNRSHRRQARLDIREGYEPQRNRRNLDYAIA